MENQSFTHYTIYQEFFLHAENPSDLLKQVIEFPGNVGDDSLAPQKISQQTVSETIKQYQSFLTSSQICRLAQSLSFEDACVYWAAIINIIRKSAFTSGYTQSSEDSNPIKHMSE